MKAIELRDLEDGDLELLMAWRSNPIVYAGFYVQRKPLTWEEHWAWWKVRKNWRDWIVMWDERAVGSVNASSLDTDTPEVGILIGEVTLWGKGVGTKALALVLAWLVGEGYQWVKASVLTDNVGSIRLFEGAGFKRMGEARCGEWSYRLDVKGGLDA